MSTPKNKENPKERRTLGVIWPILVGLLGVVLGAPASAADPAGPDAPEAPGVAVQDGIDDRVLLEALPMPTPGTGEPARFAGWLQPWTVALIFGLPVVWALLERRGDLAHAIRRRSWKRGAEDSDR